MKILEKLVEAAISFIVSLGVVNYATEELDYENIINENFSDVLENEEYENSIYIIDMIEEETKLEIDSSLVDEFNNGYEARGGKRMSYKELFEYFKEFLNIS